MKLIKALLLSVGLAVSAFAHAQPIKIVTSFPVGSGPDNLARSMAEILGDKWKTQVIVENKPGGGGQVALEHYVQNTFNNRDMLFWSNDNFVSYPELYNTKDKTISKTKFLFPMHTVQLALAVSPQFNNYQEFLAAAKKRSNFGSWGIGSAAHLAALEFTRGVGITDFAHVPYANYGQWWTDIANQQITFSFAPIASTFQLEKGGKLRYLAVLSDRRNPNYPNVPTLQELTGLKINEHGWSAIWVKESIPADAERDLHRDLTEAYNSARIQELFKTLNYVTMSISPSESRNFMRAEAEKFSRSVKKFNLSVEQK